LGISLRESGLPREDFFITTKALLHRADPANALKGSLKRLGLDYVDLYLIHGPFKVDLEQVWPTLESFKDQGLLGRVHF